MRRKRQISGGLAAPEEQAAAARIEGHNGEQGGSAEQAASRQSGMETPPGKAKPRRRPQSHRELGSAIFDVADPVKAGSELLEPGEKRADPVRLSALKMFAAWVFGNPDVEVQSKPPRIIWDLPCPPYEPIDPVESGREKSEGGEE